ncbi:hypothetical protein TNCV_293141 [Trichonephila clavipes]|nr:hypothetical protein TNCV_293141 [Trichonephila clavipes]
MAYNPTTWPQSIFCIMRFHRLGPGSNPQPWVQKASDKPTTPPRRLAGNVSFEKHVQFLGATENPPFEGLVPVKAVNIQVNVIWKFQEWHANEDVFLVF